MHTKRKRWIGVGGACVVMLVAAACSPCGPASPKARVAAEAGASEGGSGAPAGRASGAAVGSRPAAPKVVRGEIREIDLSKFFAMREAGQVLVYDVRPGLYYRMGHIPGAVNFPRNSFDPHYTQEKPNLDAAVKAGKTVVLYCTDLKCPDGGVVAGWLAELGHSVAIYQGGWEEWKSAGMPVE